MRALGAELKQLVEARLSEVHNGRDGADGRDGSVGPAGPPGPQGERGETGAVGPIGPEAARPDLEPIKREAVGSLTGFIDALRSEVTESITKRLDEIRDGKDGAPGERGPQGEPGQPGKDGAPGERGPQGDRGMSGERGERGEIGLPGPRGVAVAGRDGLPGPAGPAGPPGQQGPQGERGLPGIATKGDPGEPGPRGEVGPQGPAGSDGERGDPGPAGMLPIAKAWEPQAVHYQGAVVTHEGETFQALKDTGQAPPSADWICLAAAGEDALVPTIRGTWATNENYARLDIVALNGCSFIARKDDPGECPGAGWQLIASAGKAGIKGPPGNKGDRGERGLVGEPGPVIIGWQVDRQNYRALPVLSDGSEASPLNLRELFEEYDASK